MTDLVPGLAYLPGFLSVEEERSLVEEVERLAFRAVVMHGVAARRTTIHFGFDYGYDSWQLTEAAPLPPFLEPLRARVAPLAGTSPELLEEILVSRYPPGAGIGWHRDAPMFGPIVVGVSLGAPCTMRFRRGAKGRAAAVQVLEPRSAYVLAGEARTAFQHTIPAVKALRYSITFRTVLASRGAKGAVGRESGRGREGGSSGFAR